MYCSSNNQSFLFKNVIHNCNTKNSSSFMKYNIVFIQVVMATVSTLIPVSGVTNSEEEKKVIFWLSHSKFLG
jgi:hypothetical protein